MTRLPIIAAMLTVVIATVLLLHAQPAAADWQSFYQGYSLLGAQSANAGPETIAAAVSRLAGNPGTRRGTKQPTLASLQTKTSATTLVTTDEDSLSGIDALSRADEFSRCCPEPPRHRHHWGHCRPVHCRPHDWSWHHGHGWWCCCWWCCCWHHHHHCPEVPEPSTLALVVSGLPLLGFGLILTRRRRD